MSTCSQVMIFTYSSASLQSAKALVNEMLSLFESKLTADDLFYFGVFCAFQNYVDFNYEDFPDVEFPINVTNPNEPYNNRVGYVENIAHQVMRGEIEKPEWMITVEQEFTCFDCKSPSTYLLIEPKEEKYRPLAEALVDFLYSTSHMAHFETY